jgi:dTDP-4-dehydrorhamnose 3,5-epimerase-like enzyme
MHNLIYHCHVFELPKVHNRAGNITAIEHSVHVPFEIKRVYYLYDVPGGEQRGGHAHKWLQQLIIAVSGAFDVMLSDGVNRKIVRLDRPYIGLHVVEGIWREILNFSSGAICLVLASDIYDEKDYIRQYQDFRQWKLSK